MNKALKLAEQLETFNPVTFQVAAAAELRRLHEVNQELLEALQKATDALSGGLWDYGPGQDEHELCNEVIDECRAVIAKAGGSNEP